MAMYCLAQDSFRLGKVSSDYFGRTQGDTGECTKRGKPSKYLIIVKG